MIEEALYSRMTAHAGLAALVGTRVYPDQLPQNPTLPAVVYQRIDTRRESAMGADAPIGFPLFQVTGWAKEAGGKSARKNALELAVQIRAALQRYRGTPAGQTTEILDCFVVDERDAYDDAERGLRGVQLDFSVRHRE